LWRNLTKTLCIDLILYDKMTYEPPLNNISIDIISGLVKPSISDHFNRL